MEGCITEAVPELEPWLWGTENILMAKVKLSIMTHKARICQAPRVEIVVVYWKIADVMRK
jgi:hypothetical protein